MQAIAVLISQLFVTDQRQRLTSWLFIRLLALIYTAAFASLWVQIDGLVGPQGILPLSEQLDGSFQELGRGAWLWLPTIFWVIQPTTFVLQSVTLLGVILSMMLLVAAGPTRLILLLLFALYLSLYHAGQIFTNFQWDALLLEVGFLAIFLGDTPSKLVIFLYEWLLFRLRFMSGFFKLASDDPSWSGFTALHHYFETQPLPHIGAWYFHHLPDWVLKAGVGVTFISELIVPFFIFLPRPYRLTAAGVTIIVQLLIIASSNHNFINLLTIMLCLFLLDDRIIKSILPVGLAERLEATKPTNNRLSTGLLAVTSLLIISSSLISFTANAIKQPFYLPLHQMADSVRRFGLGNIYHIFPTMQVERQELLIEGSNDGKEWLAYRFKYTPGEPAKAPEFIVPHQPRLDWMVWFVPTQRLPQMVWFGEFLRRLHEGSDSVSGLLAENPFSDSPPRYLRVLAYRYRFATPDERAENGDWWRREYLGLFPQVVPRIP
ncbi:MAG: lipase maturation factor family protein [Gammaproteobacteria bacterium]|nr:lipase maturation factor family protein [Gammaproteobacteria bacterium]